MKTFTSTLILFIFLIQSVAANEFRAGEISIKQVSASSVEANVELLIDIHGDISDLDLCWGDGFCDNFPSITSEALPAFGLKKYTFTVLHSFQTQGTYNVTIESCCFDDELGNIPNAENEPFIIETMFVLGNNFNTTPAYSALSAIIGNVASPIGISGWDNDPEGDSYENELCDIDAPNYQQPDIALPLPSNQIFISSTSGNVSWVSPPLEGVFLLQTCVTETRNGEVISVSKRIICFMIGGLTSTVEPLKALGLIIYPNPIQDKKLWLHNANPAKSEKLNIHIHSVDQQMVFETDTDTAFENKMLDLKQLSAGVYFILMETAGGIFAERFVIGG